MATGAAPDYWWKEVSNTALSVRSIAEDPEDFFFKAIRGVVNGTISCINGEGESTEEGETSDSSCLEKREITWLSAPFEKFRTEGMQKTAEKVAKISQAVGIDGKEKDVAEALRSEKYHVLFLGHDLSPALYTTRTSSNKALCDARRELNRTPEESSSSTQSTLKDDGQSPIIALNACKEKYQEIRKKYDIEDPTPVLTSYERGMSESQYGNRLQELEQKTDKMLDDYIAKMLHFCSMQLVDKFLHNSAGVDYQAIIAGSLDEACEKYVEQRAKEGRFVRIRRFFYRKFYRVVYSLISPLLEKTLRNIVTRLREFLRSEAEINDFVEAKLDDASDYYVWVNQRRNEWVETSGGRGETFARHLHHTSQSYGRHRLTEDQLTALFGDYIVDHHIPSSEIPLLSRPANWIRKKLIRHALQEAHLVQRLLESSTQSVHPAKLELKKMLRYRLQVINDLIDQGRARQVKQLNLEGTSKEDLDLEAKKAHLISQRLGEAIDRHSYYLLSFTDILGSHGIREDLEVLDRRRGNLVSRVTELSFPKIMRDALTTSTETIFTSLLDDREGQVEEQLQRVLSILDSYEGPTSSEAERKRELQLVGRQLSELIESISSASVEAGLEANIKNVSAQKHKQVKDFVASEKVLIANFVEQFAQFQVEIGRYESNEVIPLLNNSFNLITEFLTHISTTIRSSEFRECYSDVQGDLHNCYAILSTAFEALAPKFEQLFALAHQNAAIEKALEELQGPLKMKEEEWEVKQRALAEMAKIHKKLDKIRQVRELGPLVHDYYSGSQEAGAEIQRRMQDREIRSRFPSDLPTTRELHQLFHPSWNFGRTSDFSLTLDELESDCEANLKDLEEKLTEVTPSVIDEMRRSIAEDKNALEQKIKTNHQEIRLEFEKHAGEMAHFNGLLKDFEVKGYISVGELRLYQTLGPVLINQFAPRIKKAINTLVEALGDDFHYKQLLLRLVFVDIANRQKESRG